MAGKRLLLRNFKTIGIVTAVTAFVAAVSLTPFLAPQATAAPGYAQGNHGYIGSGRTVRSTLPSPTTSGNLVVAYVVYSTSANATVTDDKGNTYTPVSSATAWGGSAQSRAYYAKNVIGGAKTITATFSKSLSFGILYTHEYSGIDKVSPLDGAKTTAGTGTAMNSGNITTTHANDLIFGAGASAGAVSAGGSGFTVRSFAEGNIVEDKNVTSTGSYNATATHGGGSWVMQVVAFKSAAATDTQAPTIPTNLNATATSTSQIDLTWNSSIDNVGVTGYKVYRNGVQVATSTGTYYQDTGLAAGTAYTYTITAHDAAGNNSVQSGAASATTLVPDTEAPSIPANLTATTASASQINLSWDVSTDNVAVAGYKVFQGGVQIATTTNTSYQHTGLAEGTTYNYTVAAYDTAGNTSVQSAIVSATTDVTPPDTEAPSVPTGLTASASSSTQVNLSWIPSADNVGVASYRVTRDGTVLTTTTATTLNDTNLTAETTYSYTVAALDAAGNVSADSTVASATTPAAPSSDCNLPNYPNASCTGVPAGTNLVPFNPTCIPATADGSSCETTAIDGVTKCAYYREGNNGPISAGYCTIKTAGAVLNGVTIGRVINEGQPNEQTIGGCIVMDAPNVTIKNSKIFCPAVYGVSSYGGTDHGGLIIEDVEIDCLHTNTTGIAYQGVTINRAHIHGCENGVDAYRNVTLTNSYIHDIYEGATGHGDGLQSADGSNVTIDHNTILSESTNASINVNHNSAGPTTTNLTISNNFLAGGSYNLYCPKPTSVNVKILNNHFSTMFYSTVGSFGPHLDCQGETTSGNVWHETGILMSF